MTKYRKKLVEVEAFQMTHEHRYGFDIVWPWWLRDVWIIRGVDGNLSSCSPTIFEKTYELAEGE